LGLLIGGALLSAGVGAGAVLRSRRRGVERALPQAPPRKTVLSERGFGLELGDVVDVEERSLWLKHAWLALEGDDAIAALFFSGQDVVVSQPGAGLRLCLTQEVELHVAEEVPSALELDGARFERVRRLPVRLFPVEDSPTPPFDEALLSELRGLSGQVLWVLTHGGFCKAFAGRSLDASEVEYWGGGNATMAD
jgi:hypothetical protein